MNWVDLIVIIILVTSSLRGLVKGFIISLFNLVGFFIAAYIAKLYYPVLVGYIYKNTNFINRIESFIYERVFKIMEGNENGLDKDLIINGFKLPAPIKESLGNNINLHTGEITKSIGQALANEFTYIFVTIISIIIVFLAAKILLAIVVHVVDSIAKLPILRTFNRLTGFAFGLIKGVLIIYIIFAILTPVISMFPEGFIATGTYESTLGSYFYTQNVIINYLSGKGFII
ncbi:CvpA family protein [Caldisalinibacter kiritimatiensis]|uniref:CvpA family protein n=1 Tax=Caldisalinibacter kiritimatiensis TaxID=1304284 RepID=UPI000556CFED|nr:CvpA family protein [Caldisalinibacter kiritimatiensis]